MKEKVALVDAIRKETALLTDKVNLHGLSHKETIVQSQKLGNLIAKYQQFHREENKH